MGFRFRVRVWAVWPLTLGFYPGWTRDWDEAIPQCIGEGLGFRDIQNTTLRFRFFGIANLSLRLHGGLGQFRSCQAIEILSCLWNWGGVSAEELKLQLE